jgi:peptidylprolyl isomerase
MRMGDQPAGRIVFRLFDEECPTTARNFRELATGLHGYGYAGSPVHRVHPEVNVEPSVQHAVNELRSYQNMIHGGDITNGDGTGGRSALGGPFRGKISEYMLPQLL